MDIYEICAEIYLSLSPEDFDQDYIMKILNEEIEELWKRRCEEYIKTY